MPIFETGMQLKLEQIVPIPLLEKSKTYQSGIWRQSLVFDKGEQVFIQAPSGTGKTTLVHLLYKMRTDMQGKIYWNNRDLSTVNKEQLATLRSTNISIIFQDIRLFPDLTAWENLEVKRNLTNTTSEATVTEWMQRLGIADKKQSLGRTLSYGEQQRVAIIRALLQPFEWLLMDEPFSHLDDNNISKAAALIQEVVQTNNAGILLADLEDNNHFNYTRKLQL
jgi:putative ABC transport system ATP-binding protein